MITAETLSIAYFSKDPIWVVCTSDELGVQPNLKIKCLVQLNNIPGVYRLASVYESVNEDGEFVFELSGLIDGMIANWFDVADFAVTSKICPSVPIRAEIFLTEVYEGTTGDSTMEATYIVKGGQRIEELDAINDWWTNFEVWADGDQTKIPFLTNKTKNCAWKPGQPEFLYYYNRLGSGMSNLVLNIEYFDVNDASIDADEYTLSGVSNNRIAQFNIGKLMQERFVYDSSDAYYKVWLTKVGDIVSEIRTYYIDREYYPNARYLIFENKKGGFDTVALTGDDVVGGTIDSAFVSKEYKRGQHVVDGIRSVTKKRLERKVKKNSGWVSKLERAWLVELLESKLVYEVTGHTPGNYENAVLMPIIIETKDLPIVGTGEFISGFLVEWIY